MSVKSFFIKQLVKRKMGQLPEHMQEKFTAAIERDPEFFTLLSKEIDAEIKSGKPQMAASMAVMRKHQKKLQELLM